MCIIRREKISPGGRGQRIVWLSLAGDLQETKSLWRQSVSKGLPQEESGELKFSNVHPCQPSLLSSCPCVRCQLVNSRGLVVLSDVKCVLPRNTDLK